MGAANGPIATRSSKERLTVASLPENVVVPGGRRLKLALHMSHGLCQFFRSHFMGLLVTIAVALTVEVAGNTK